MTRRGGTSVTLGHDDTGGALSGQNKWDGMCGSLLEMLRRLRENRKQEIR